MIDLDRWARAKRLCEDMGETVGRKSFGCWETKSDAAKARWYRVAGDEETMQEDHAQYDRTHYGITTERILLYDASLFHGKESDALLSRLLDGNHDIRLECPAVAGNGIDDREGMPMSDELRSWLIDLLMGLRQGAAIHVKAGHS